MNPFQVEEKRDFYGAKDSFSKFKKLYLKDIPSIKNNNSSELWNRLNFSRSKRLQASPIYVDKVSTILRFLKNKNGKLLDVGFGKGYLERRLKDGNISLFGIDISNKSVNDIRWSVNGNFKKGSILNIPFRSDTFDYALCLDVLEHISPRYTFKALGELNRVLKSKSILIVSVPLNEGLEEMVKKNINPNAHVRSYTFNILKAELKICGFSVEKKIYLSAFETNYFLKKMINQILKIREPNLLIVIAKKK